MGLWDIVGFYGSIKQYNHLNI